MERVSSLLMTLHIGNLSGGVFTFERRRRDKVDSGLLLSNLLAKLYALHTRRKEKKC